MRVLTKNRIHGQWLIGSLRLRCICITRRLHGGYIIKFKLRSLCEATKAKYLSTEACGKLLYLHNWCSTD